MNGFNAQRARYFPKERFRDIDHLVHSGVQAWSFDAGVMALSSACVGGGLAEITHLVNIGVPMAFSETDLTAAARAVSDQIFSAQHADGSCESASGCSDTASLCALFTAADVTQLSSCSRESVLVQATIGITKPTWAADQTGGYDTDFFAATKHLANSKAFPESHEADIESHRLENQRSASQNTSTKIAVSESSKELGRSAHRERYEPGTINIVVQIPVPIEPQAAVNLVMTVTEAKTQALLGANVNGTGTASDAVVVIWPKPTNENPKPVEFGGPRSHWGAIAALATYQAMYEGLAKKGLSSNGCTSPDLSCEDHLDIDLARGDFLSTYQQKMGQHK